MKHALATLLLTTALATPLAAQQTDLTGTVAETFGNTVIVNTAQGRVLMTLPEGADVPAAGTPITATGSGDAANFAAEQVTVAAQPDAAQTAAPAQGEEVLPVALRGLGLTDIQVRRDDDDDETDIHAGLASGGWILAETDRGRLEEIKIDQADVPTDLLAALLPDTISNTPQLSDFTTITEINFDSDGEIEIEGIAADGMEVKMEFGTDGSLREFEREVDDRRSISADAARTQLQQLGYTDLGFVNRAGRHVEVVARNTFGDLVEVRIDESGRVERERVWNR